jgi:hypothetical protein
MGEPHFWPLAALAYGHHAGKAVAENDHNVQASTAGYKTVDETVPHVLKIIDIATRDGQGGQFWNFDGEKNPW